MSPLLIYKGVINLDAFFDLFKVVFVRFCHQSYRGTKRGEVFRDFL